MIRGVMYSKRNSKSLRHEHLTAVNVDSELNPFFPCSVHSDTASFPVKRKVWFVFYFLSGTLRTKNGHVQEPADLM